MEVKVKVKVEVEVEVERSQLLSELTSDFWLLTSDLWPPASGF